MGQHGMWGVIIGVDTGSFLKKAHKYYKLLRRLGLCIPGAAYRAVFLAATSRIYRKKEE